MRYVTFAILGLGVLAIALSFSYHVLSAGTHGAIVVIASAVPVALAVYGTIVKPPLPRWASVTSAVSFLVVGMKTTEGDDLQNIMLVAFVGMLLSIVLAIRPERRLTKDRP